MNYICEIKRNTPKDNFWYFIAPYSLKLPLVDKFIQNGEKANGEEDFVVFMVEDRHNPDYIYIYPPKEITEEQMNLINQKWDYCVKNNILNLKFDI